MGIQPVIVDHVQDEKDRRITLFANDKDTFDEFMRIILSEVNEIETMFNDILTKTNIDDAFGYTLDVLGKIIGLSRYSGQTDSSYRLDLKAWVKYLFSQGEINTLLFVLKALTDSTNVSLREYFPGSIMMYFDGVYLNAEFLASTMKKTAMAGIRLDVVYDMAGGFRFDAGPGFDDGMFTDVIG